MQDSRGIRRIVDSPDSHFPIIGQGFRNRSSFFSDFFDKDPFDDPFFTQPFGSMFASMNELFEPPQHRHSKRHFDSRLQEQPSSRGVVIEELLPDDHEEPEAARTRSHQEPIVEHPDDNALQRNNSVGDGDVSKSFTQSYAFSSVTYGGPQGTYYKSSAMRRAGANGLFEEIRDEKDSINGHETSRVLHGLGNKGHAVTLKKSAGGKEDYVETLHNITEEEKKGFDETWKKNAKKYLPGFGRSRGLTMLKSDSAEREGSEAHASSSPTKPRKHLPWRWPWANKA